MGDAVASGLLASVVLALSDLSVTLVARDEARGAYGDLLLGAGSLVLLGGLAGLIVFAGWWLRSRAESGSVGAESADAADATAYFAFSAVVLLVACLVAHRMTTAFQDERFGVRFLTLVVSLTAVLLGAFAPPGRRAFSWSFRVATRVLRRLPPTLRASLVPSLLTAPASLVLGALSWSERDNLGAVVWLPLGAILAIWTVQIACWGFPGSSSLRRRAFGLAGAGLAVSATTSRWPEPAGAAIEASLGVSIVVRHLAGLSDFDRDGHGSLFVGRDCAAFDATRNPSQPDEPGNGVDEDCDGTDAVRSDSEQRSALSGKIPASGRKKYDVVFIVIDALRGDSFPWSGGPRKLAPELVRFGRQNLVFESAWSQSSTTRLSLPSMLSGAYPSSMHWQKTARGYQPASDRPQLADWLGRHGYRTGLVANNWVRKEMSAVTGRFETFATAWPEIKRYRKWRNGSAAWTTARAIEFIHDAGDAPFFLLAYYEGPHAPYHDLRDRGAPGFGGGERGRYEQEIWYADRYVRVLLDYLVSRPRRWKDTIVVITADHGEEFGEHGGRHHGHTCHREVTHVPLFLHLPGVAGRHVRTPVALVDIVPTLLDFLGVDPGPVRLDGQSLLYALDASEGGDRAIRCDLFSDDRPMATLRRAVRTPRHLFVKHYADGRLELYDLHDDGKEINNVADEPEHREARDRLDRILAETYAMTLSR